MQARQDQVYREPRAAAERFCLDKGMGSVLEDAASWRRGLFCASEVSFALGVSVIWAVLYNLPFWEHAVHAMGYSTPRRFGFLASLFLLVLSMQSLLLLLMPTRMMLRGAAGALFIVAALSAYFCGEYGVLMNQDMLRNVLQTDAGEVGGLMSFKLIATVAIFGVLPAILVWRVALPPISALQRLKQRAGALGVMVLACAIALGVYSVDYAVFFREHKPIRSMLVPTAPVFSLAQMLKNPPYTGPLLNPAGEARRIAVARSPRPLVIFLVIGETARAEDFQLGGYSRATNPQLAAIENLVYFSQLSSCGTATAISLPCMFSHLPREQFDVDEAGRYTNLLDALTQGGFDVQWRDNNAGCKGVCARVTQVSYADRPDQALCPHSYCYDEVMLMDLDARLRDIQRDTVMVFHQIGSHGPAYAQRYPPKFEVFKPACRSNQLQHCTRAQIVNAYDNTIAYTDHVLARQIEALRKASDHLDSLLIYVSDHGESLGEQGIYLHGMPYSFAPRAQKKVPMLMWISSEYTARVGLAATCMRVRAREALSHDNLYHTILGAAGVRNAVYDSRLDILSGCHNDALGVEQG